MEYRGKKGAEPGSWVRRQGSCLLVLVEKGHDELDVTNVVVQDIRRMKESRGAETRRPLATE